MKKHKERQNPCKLRHENYLYNITAMINQFCLFCSGDNEDEFGFVVIIIKDSKGMKCGC